MEYPKLVIFDMDGLLFDSERLFRDLLIDTAKAHGYEITEELYAKTLGTTGGHLADIMYSHLGTDYPFEEMNILVEKKLKCFVKSGNLPIKKGVKELLDFFRSKEIPCCIASSSRKSIIELNIKQTGLEPYFEFVTGGDMVEISKPNPEIFLLCTKRASCEPKDALVFEDSESGIMAAHRAGIPVICIPDLKYPDKEYASKTAHILTDLSEVLTVFK